VNRHLAGGPTARPDVPPSDTHVVMFLYASGIFDPRVHRSATSLAAAGYRVTMVGLQAANVPDRERADWGDIVRVGRSETRRALDRQNPLRARRRPFRFWQALWLIDYARRYRGWRAAAIAAGLEASRGAARVIWHGHDLTGLSPAAGARARRKGPLVYDSHELYLESGSLPHLPRPAWRRLFAYERSLARQADLVITVNRSIARELATRYEITMPTIVMNCPPSQIARLVEGGASLRDVVGGRGAIIVIHGSLSPGKGLLEAVGALRKLPADTSLVILGRGELSGLLHRLADSEDLKGRLHLVEPVPQTKLIRLLAGADVALITFTPDTLNQRYATPNRLFESLAAGVPVVVSDFPELRHITLAHDVGLVCDPTDPASIARAVARLLDEDPESRAARRVRARSAFEGMYNWERQERELVEGYSYLYREPPTRTIG
jgi:glycosyltransferase involved in cell wall biosynthesis